MMRSSDVVDLPTLLAKNPWLLVMLCPFPPAELWRRAGDVIQDQRALDRWEDDGGPAAPERR